LPWFYAVAERDHSLQNPTSPTKIRRLGEHIRLDENRRVLDVACGRAGPAIVLAETLGCRIIGVEKAREFAAVARERVAEAKLGDLVEIIQRDAKDFPLEPESFDAAICLGASFIWDGLPGTLSALEPAVRPGGYVVVGEPFWRRWPLPDDPDHMGYTNLVGTARRFQAAGIALVGLIAASEDDWDAYESLHWRALEEWLAVNPADPEADELRRQHEQFRDAYLSVEREQLGWAVFIGWKPERLGAGR
jgi:SAM-dependent methyltransferase